MGGTASHTDLVLPTTGELGLELVMGKQKIGACQLIVATIRATAA